MKNFFFILLLVFLLAACGPAAPVMTAAPEVAITSTIPLTSTLTLTPTESATPEIVFEPMELGTPKRPAQCSPEDYDGRIQAQERKDMKPFPEGTSDGHWAKIPSVNVYTPFFTGQTQIVSVCELSANFLGYPDEKMTVVGFQLPDNTLVHLAFDTKIFYQYMKSYKNRGMIGISNLTNSSTYDYFKKHKRLWAIELMKKNGADGLQKDLNRLENGGTITNSMEKKIYVGAIN